MVMLSRIADTLDRLERNSTFRSEGEMVDYQPVLDLLNERLGSMTVKAATVAERRNKCAVCGTHIEQPKRGRPREYCSDRCRKVLFDAKALLAHRQTVAVERNSEFRSEGDDDV